MEASALRAPAGLGRGSGTSPWLRLRSDEQLVGLFRSGNEEAFRVIHDRYRARLYAYARQMLGGSGPDAEDVLQDVFLRAYRALRVDERPVSMRAWLYRVAHNRCIDHVRRPTPAPAEIFELSRTPVHDPLVEAERREDLRRLIEDVRRLPEQQRSALLMREMVGMSYADLATALDTSVPAVKSLLVRARIGLVEAIEARDADCADIRLDLAASYDRGVRASGRARRHLRDCAQCTTYRAQLRGVRQGFAALNPAVAAPGLLAKLLGLGGSGAAAGGAASGTAVTVGGAAAVSIPKVAALVCCAAVMGGSALEVEKVVAPEKAPSRERSARTTNSASQSSAPAGVAAAAVTAAAIVTELRRSGAPVLSREPRITEAEDLALHPSPPMTPSFATTYAGRNGSGGAEAPSEEDAVTVGAADKDGAGTTDGDEATVDEDLIKLPTTTGDATTGATSATGTGSSTSGSSSGSGSGSSTSGSGTSSSTTSGSSTSGSSTSGQSTSGSTSSGSASSSSGTSSTSPGSSTGSGSSSGSASGGGGSTATTASTSSSSASGSGSGSSTGS